MTGTPAAVEALIDSHRQFLAFVERRVGDRHAAEEILQTAFVRGLEKGGDVRDPERATAWFYRLLRNAIVDHWRRGAAEAKGLERFAADPTAMDDGDPETEAEVCRCFEALLPNLRPGQSELLRRVDLGGEKPADLAREMDVTANALMVRLHRARRALRGQLVDACRTCATHGCLDCTCQSSPKG